MQRLADSDDRLLSADSDDVVVNGHPDDSYPKLSDAARAGLNHALGGEVLGPP